MRINNLKGKKEFLFVIIFFTCLVFGILVIFGTLTSGFHMVDDHEYIRFFVDLNENGKEVGLLIKEEMNRDGYLRFRPLYYPIRILQTIIFGTNLFAMSVVKGIETVLACILIYYIARKLNCSVKYAIATALFIMVGPQSATWWKLGPQELTGTWIFALGIWFILKSKETKKKRYNMAAILLFFVDSLYKESFIMLLPAVILFYLYMELEGKAINWKNLGKAIKGQLASLLVLGIIFLAEIYLIVFEVGTNQIGYVGIDTAMGLWDYIKVLLNNVRLYLRIGPYIIFVLALCVLFASDLLKMIVRLKWELFFALVMVLPQMVLYSKSGLEERYVIPWVYGVAYFFVIVLNRQPELEKKKKRKWYDYALGLLLAGHLILVCYEANYFTFRGEGIAQMLKTTVELSTEESNILSAFAPYDESDKTTSFWLHTKGRDKVYVYRDGQCTDWYNKGAGNTVTLDDIDIIMMYNYNDRHFIEEPDIDLTDFEIREYGTMRLAVRR